MWKLLFLIALFVLPALWFYLKHRSHGTQSTVVICGPSESGKTALLLYLTRGKYVQSQTSQSVNKVSLKVGAKMVSVIDTPGSFRLLPESMKYIEQAQALVFVVDSSDKQSFKMAAQLLVDIILNPKIIAARPRMLFLANKKDVIGSRDVEAVLHFVQLDAERILKAYKSESHMKKIPNETMPLLQSLTQGTFSIEHTPLQVTLGTSSVSSGNVDDVLKFME
ncbi:signal recognition particle receptor beta subunit, putative [Babesia ovis]|uniref:Signal recognition particle receptor subunit beta n=1 Tax=Babesia ovis TaxID=5869 RepID=A0A9W5T7M9_BABOV|nr:signal recognition particle receptor beta subunit, putative [Babesia ovis]